MMKGYELFLLGIIILLAGTILLLIFLLQKAYKQEQFYKRLLENSKDGIYYYQTFPEEKFLYMSSSTNDIFGNAPQIVYENYKHIFETVHPEDYQNLYNKTRGKVDYSKPQFARWLNSKGEYVHTEDIARPIFDKYGKLIGVEGSIRDITERRKLEEQLEYRSTHDIMTGLYNRCYFEQVFERLDKREEKSVGIIICDINGLKNTNDNLGHSYGDNLIKESARILYRFSSKNSIVSRIGGDEFCIIVENEGEEYIKLMISNINNAIDLFNEKSKEIKLHLSVGYSTSKKSLHIMNCLFHEADKKMYQSKKEMKAAIL